jgi:DNA-binding protein H-NS
MPLQGLIIRVKKMKPHDLESKSVDELWSLHEQVTLVLTRKISAEKARLEQRLRELGQSESASAIKVSHARRPYPRVFPKYRNPTRPSETWAGRGKQPRWLTAQLRSGKKLDDFRIQPSSDRTRGVAAQGSGRQNKKTVRRRSA